MLKSYLSASRTRRIRALLIYLVVLLMLPSSFSLVHAQLDTAGTRIAFTSYRDGNGEIYTVLPDGSDLLRLTNDPADDIAPSWSADGKEILFASNRGGGGYDLYIISAEGGEARRLTTSGTIAPPAKWSPDGSKIAYISSETGVPELYVMDAFGLNALRLTVSTSDVINRDPSWSPDSNYIAFASSRTAGFQLYIVSVDGKKNYTLLSDFTIAREPSWSPTGTRIAYVTERSGIQQVNVVNSNGTEARTLAIAGGSVLGAITWSPDETRLVYMVQTGTDSSTYTLNSVAFDDQPPVSFLDNAWQAGWPDWYESYVPSLEIVQKPINGIVIRVNQQIMRDWNGIDAVELVGHHPDGIHFRQWANRAESTDSQDPRFSADKAVGPPNARGCRDGDGAGAWFTVGAWDEAEITLYFAENAIPDELNIYQNNAPGSIVQVRLLPADGSAPIPIPNSADPRRDCPSVFNLQMKGAFAKRAILLPAQAAAGTNSPDSKLSVSGVIIRLDQRLAVAWNGIDAVELVGTLPDGSVLRQWGLAATADSEYAGYEAQHATGEPDAVGCDSNGGLGAWMSLNANDTAQLTVYFKQRVIPTEISIYENFVPGSIVEVLLLATRGGTPIPIPNSRSNSRTCPNIYTLSVSPDLIGH